MKSAKPNPYNEQRQRPEGKRQVTKKEEGGRGKIMARLPRGPKASVFWLRVTEHFCYTVRTSIR